MAFPSGYSWKKKLTLDTSSGGANIPSTLSNYSILVRLTASNFDFSHARSDGYDVCFYDSSGNALSYERERHDDASDLAEYWVRIASLTGNDATQYIWMYYGNASASDGSSGSNTFRPADGYLTVLHLKETGTNTRVDSTGNGYNATASGFGAGEKGDGRIAKGDDFYGDTRSLSLGDPAGLELGTSTWVISMWARPDARGQWDRLLNKEDVIRWLITDTYYPQLEGWQNSGSWFGSGDVGNAMVNGIWDFLALRRSTATAMDMFRNSSKIAGYIVSGGVDANSENWYIGYNPGYSPQSWDGCIDEFRMESTRSDDWMRLRHQNEQATDTLIDFGSEESAATDSYSSRGIGRGICRGIYR